MRTETPQRWRIAAESVLVLALAVLALTVLLRFPAKQAGDEANWVGTARYFDILFKQGDVSAEAWADSYWTRTQPMIPRYIMGGWLSLRGYDYSGLDPNYDHRRKWFSNVEEGRAPGEAMLTEVRVPMRWLAAICVLLTYFVVRVLAGPVGGAAAALLFCGSSYLPLHLVRAMGEPPFLAFLLATLLVCLVAIKRASGRAPSWRWGVLAGVLLGLSFASKLTAIIAMVGVVAWGVWATLGPLLAARLSSRKQMSVVDTPPSPVRTPSSRRMLGSPLAWAFGVVAVALVVFVAHNPFLWHDPVGRTLLLFQNRQQEMAAQAANDAPRAVTSRIESARHVWNFSLVEDAWSDGRLRWPLEAILAIVGVAWLAARAIRPTPDAESLLLLWVGGFYAGVTLGLGYFLHHYFVPTAALGLILDGLAVGWGVQAAWRLIGRFAGRRRPASTNTRSVTAH